MHMWLEVKMVKIKIQTYLKFPLQISFYYVSKQQKVWEAWLICLQIQLHKQM